MSKHIFTIPLPQSKVTANLDSLKSYGINPTATHGTLPKSKGVTLSYTYNGSAITFTVEGKPFIVPNSMIEKEVREFLEKV